MIFFKEVMLKYLTAEILNDNNFAADSPKTQRISGSDDPNRFAQ